MTDPEPAISLAEAERLVSEFLGLSVEEVRAMPRLELFRRLVGESDG